MEKHPINLFQSQAMYSPTLSMIERYLRMTRYVLLSLLLVIGGITLIVFFVFRVQQQSLEQRREQLFSSVQQNMTKEAMLLTLRARVSALKKIMLFQVSIAPHIDTALLIASPPQLTSFSLGDANSVSIGVESTTLEEAIDIVRTVIRLTEEKKIKNPTIVSIMLNKNATVTMGFSYVTILQ